MNAMPNALQRGIHRFLMLKPVSALLPNILHRADAFLLRLTRDRYTFTGLVGLPIAQLTMTGARTGTLRTITLVGVPDDDRLALFATNFGRRRNPGWYYNLKAHPECQVVWRGERGTFIARETDGAEYEKYWRLGVAYYEGYEKYKLRAGRRIPVLVLEPKQL
jgi:deazaflavin-dependent oxidoreductase (nitroreductase family)